MTPPNGNLEQDRGRAAAYGRLLDFDRPGLTFEGWAETALPTLGGALGAAGGTAFAPGKRVAAWGADSPDLLPELDAARAARAPVISRTGGKLPASLAIPIEARGEFLGGFVFRARSAAAFGPGELEFARAVSALGFPLWSALRWSTVSAKSDALESAYVDRYRELVEANRRLRQLARFKDDALAVVSHDLRGPLQILLGHAKLLADAPLGKDEQLSLQAVLRQGKKLAELVEGVIDRARTAESATAFEPSEVDLAALCRIAVTDQDLAAAERQVSLALDAAEVFPAIVDRAKMGSLLQRLIAHALSRAPAGSEVRVACSRQGERVLIAISDHGETAEAATLSTLFERRLRGDEVSHRLVACREIVELHGGEIQAAGEGGGLTIRVALPSSAVRLPGEKLNPERTERARVLVVEDDPHVAAITTEILRSRWRVELAVDGAEAIAMAHALLPDLILMDVFLPKVDGLDAAATLKASPDTRDIPVILVSAHRDVADKVRGLSLGAVDYLAKPYRANELVERVEKALAGR